LLLFKGALFVVELFSERLAPGFLLLQICQLFLVEGDLRGGFVD
jgi:hypothetical protein